MPSKNLSLTCNKILLSIVVSFALFTSACQEQKKNTPSTTTIPPTLIQKKKATPKRKLSPDGQGRTEWYAFKKKYQETWKEQPTTFPYSQGTFFKVYHLNCEGECQEAVFRKRRDYGIEIPKQDFLDLVMILKAPASYDNSTAACFDPKLGVVVYDKDSIPTEFLSICLDCNNVRSYPGKLGVSYANEDMKGFSQKARTQLRTLFFRWGIDYYGYSHFWDDEADFLAYKKQKEQ
ncbi:MAG: hypothetical protein ACRBFS_18080 [Aureispira sp.]